MEAKTLPLDACSATIKCLGVGCRYRSANMSRLLDHEEKCRAVQGTVIVLTKMV